MLNIFFVGSLFLAFEKLEFKLLIKNTVLIEIKIYLKEIKLSTKIKNKNKIKIEINYSSKHPRYKLI